MKERVVSKIALSKKLQALAMLETGSLGSALKNLADLAKDLEDDLDDALASSKYRGDLAEEWGRDKDRLARRLVDTEKKLFEVQAERDLLRIENESLRTQVRQSP